MSIAGASLSFGQPSGPNRLSKSAFYYPVSDVWYKSFKNGSHCGPLWVDPKGNNGHIPVEEWKNALDSNGLSDTKHCDILRFPLQNGSTCNKFLCLGVAMMSHDTPVQTIPHFSEKFYVQSTESMRYLTFQLKKKFNIDKDKKVRLWKRDQSEASKQGCVLISDIEYSGAIKQLVSQKGDRNLYGSYSQVNHDQYSHQSGSQGVVKNGQYDIKMMYDNFCKGILGSNFPQFTIKSTELTLILEVADVNNVWPTMVYDDIYPVTVDKDYKVFSVFSKIGSGHQGYGSEEKLDDALVSFKQELKESTERLVDKQFKKLCTDIKGTVISREGEMKTEKDTAIRQIAQNNELKKELDEKKVLLDSEEKNIQRMKQNLMEEKKSFEEERTNFHEMKSLMENVQTFQSSKVTLNVGGQHFVTSLMTLKKSEDSMLGAMFSGRHEIVPDGDGSYFIDRDGSHFRFILNYLRDGGIAEGVLPNDRHFLNQLLQEATYYNISGLISYIESKLNSSVPS